MDQATLKSNPSSRSRKRSEKNKLHHGIWQVNAAIRVVVAIGFTFLGLMSILIIGSVDWEQSSVRRDGTRLTDGATTGETSQNSIKVVDLTRRPKTNQYQFRPEVEPPPRVFEGEKSSAIKPTDIGIKIESATKDTGLSCGENNVQCKFRSGGEPPGHKGSQAWDDDQELSSLHRSYMDEYGSKLLLLLETNQKALASILDSRLDNHAFSTFMTTHGEVGSRYEAGFGFIEFSGGFEGILARLQYFLDTGIYGVCPSPSSVEYLFQYEYCPRLEGPRLWKRWVSGIIRDHLYALGSAFRSLPDANTPLLGPVSWASTFFSLPDTNTPLLGPVSWARTSFLSAIQTALVGSISPAILVLIPKCGQRLYDDFQEIRPEAAAQLEYELNRRYNNVGSKSSNGGQGSHGNSGRNRWENPACSNVTSWWFPSSWGSAQSSSLPFHEPQNVPGDDIERASTEPQPESMFLLLCIPHLRWASKLVHMDVHKLRSDQSFFEELRSHYHSMRGLWTSWFSLKQLTRIQFVQFELHKNELVDIRKLNDLPPETRDDYRYRPVPPEIIPPIGENLLMHLYDHPEDADDDGFCLDRVPKKLRKRLTCSQRIGWGVNFGEGLHVKKVCVLGLIGLFTSTALGMAWSIKRNDVQEGFGVAAFVLMASTFVTGILQAALDTK